MDGLLQVLGIVGGALATLVLHALSCLPPARVVLKDFKLAYLVSGSVRAWQEHVR